MVVQARLAFLLEKVLARRSCQLGIGYSGASWKLKFKITVGAVAGEVPGPVREDLAMMVEAIRHVVGSGSSVDRGHRHSDGRVVRSSRRGAGRRWRGGLRNAGW